MSKLLDVAWLLCQDEKELAASDAEQFNLVMGAHKRILSLSQFGKTPTGMVTLDFLLADDLDKSRWSKKDEQRMGVCMHV